MKKAKILSKTGSEVTIEIKLQITNSILESEELLQESLNQAGILGSELILASFDTDGAPIMIGETKLTSKGKEEKIYQCPYGEVNVSRHVYQSSSGGKTYCPLEYNAKIIMTATPKYSKMISSKYSMVGATSVAEDFQSNHARSISSSYVKNISDMVGAVALIKEDSWSYEVPELENISTISIGLDGTCMLMKDDGWREAMTGSIAFHDKDGNRKSTIYTAARPEYGKDTFLNKFSNIISRVKDKYKNVNYLGVADGAKSNWSFLKNHTEHQILDFYHVSEYVGSVGSSLYNKKNENNQREEWIKEKLHTLKNTSKGASTLLREFKTLQEEDNNNKKTQEELSKTISYFTNNKDKMKYSYYVDNNWPIGSGVTEAACKIIVKERLCGSGMRWTNEGASVVLKLRCLTKSENQWNLFWKRIDRYGLNLG